MAIHLIYKIHHVVCHYNLIPSTNKLKQIEVYFVIDRIENHICFNLDYKILKLIENE